MTQKGLEEADNIIKLTFDYIDFKKETIKNESFFYKIKAKTDIKYFLEAKVKMLICI
jgi:secreted Zn-dependent insulinase-like peptidase